MMNITDTTNISGCASCYMLYVVYCRIVEAQKLAEVALGVLERECVFPCEVAGG